MGSGEDVLGHVRPVDVPLGGLSQAGARTSSSAAPGTLMSPVRRRRAPADVVALPHLRRVRAETLPSRGDQFDQGVAELASGFFLGLQSNRETAHHLGENFSRCNTWGGSWRDYPFLRMPNVHVDAGPKGSPTPEEMIADTKDGVMIDGRGSYSIDQQRYNGQFGGDAFWEIKNGKITRQVTDVTYNAITTDFWANLDGITGPNEWEMQGTGGDAKGQPTQTNSISHGSPYLRIRKIMVGAAFA